MHKKFLCLGWCLFVFVSCATPISNRLPSSQTQLNCLDQGRGLETLRVFQNRSAELVEDLDASESLTTLLSVTERSELKSFIRKTPLVLQEEPQGSTAQTIEIPCGARLAKDRILTTYLQASHFSAEKTALISRAYTKEIR